MEAGEAESNIKPINKDLQIIMLQNETKPLFPKFLVLPVIVFFTPSKKTLSFVSVL